MSNFDDLFTDGQIAPAVKPKEDDFNKDAWKEQKQQERDALYEQIDQTALALSGDPGKFQDYLDIQSRLNLYSVGNLLLIQAQMPTATKLKNFESWKAEGAGIRKGQHPISILEPGKPYMREDGSIAASYNVKKVFDISQSNAKLEQKRTLPVGRPLLKALMTRAPVSIKGEENMPEGVGARFYPDNYVILIRKEMDAPDIFRCLSNELAHAELAKGGEYSREDAAFTAYCTSYVLCRQYGVDVSSFQFDSLPDSFATGDAQVIRAELSAIHDTANSIGGRMRKALEQSKPDKQEER